jgi:hypothetical protein
MASKRQFAFHWADSPRGVTALSRAEMAKLFRSYRQRKSLYLLSRCGNSEYEVRIVGTGGVTGIFTALQNLNLVSGKEFSNV